MNKKLLPLLVTLFSIFGNFSFAQNVNYQLEVRYLGWDGRGDQSGTPEYAYLVTPYDNLSTGTQRCYYYGDDLPGTDANGGVTSIAGGNFNVINQSARIRTVFNTAATTIGINLTAYEKDCSNNCSYESGCNCVFLLGCLTEDDDLASCNGLTAVSFKNQPPCQWNDYSVVRCGSFTIAIRIRWEYASLSAGALTIPGTAYSFCGLGDPPLINSSSPASNYASYQWQSQDNCTGGWTNIPGATSLTYDPPFGLTTTRCYRRVANVCQINGGSLTAVTNTSTATLNSGIFGNNIGSSNSFCAASAPPQNLTGGAVNNGGANSDFLYTWQVSTDGITFTDVQSSSSVLNYTTPTLTSTRYYRRKTCPAEDADLGGPAPPYCIGSCDNFSNVLTIGVTPPITNNVISNAQTVCGVTDPGVLNGSLPGGGNGTFVYQWQQSSALAGPYTDIFGANSQNYDPSSLSSTTYFRRVITSGVCTDNGNVIAVTVIPDIDNNIISGAQSYCGSGDAPAFTATVPTGGTGVYTYLWEQSTTGLGGWSPASGVSNLATYDPPVLAATTYYRRTVFSGSVPCSLSSNILTIVITAPITNNNINGNQINCDTLQLPALQTGSSPGGGNGIFSFFWQQSTNLGASWTNIAGSLTQSYQPGVIGQTTVFRRVVSSSVCSDTSNRDTITIIPIIRNNTINGYQRFCGPGNPANIVGVAATGGTGTLTYRWESSPDGTIWTPIAGTNTVSYDPPAVINSTTYYRRIVTSSVCTSVSNVSAAAILRIPVVSQLIKTDLTCFKSNDGTINVAGNSFNGGIAYSIDNQATYQSSGSFTSLPIGSYPVFVRDDSNCVNNYNLNPVVITQPDSLYLSYTKADASCANVLNGQINITPTGGSPLYSYSLNNGAIQSSNVFASLASGSYFITLFDRNGCKDTATAVIANSYTVVASIDSQRNVSCFGGNDGQVAVKLTGGTPALSYSINNIVFQANPIFAGLTAGTYLVTLKDSKGCTDVLPVVISQPTQVSVRIDSTKNGLCAGSLDASIYITPLGGTPPFTYSWSNGSTSKDLLNVGPGTYNVTVTDSKGCSGTQGATVTQPLPLFVAVAQFNDVLCNGDSTGAIDITVSGGVPPYQFVWNNGKTLEDLAGLKAGNYSVTVTDANGCVKNLSQAISEPTPLTSSTSSTVIACAGGNNGTASVTPLGGTLPYSYLWSNGATTAAISGLSGGTYTVTTTDKNGCKSYSSVIITAPQPIVLSTSVTNVLCNGSNTGAVTLTVQGGTPTFSFAWSNGATSQSLSGVVAGTYTVTVTDGNLCTATASATVTQSTAIVVSGTAFNALCAGTNNGSINLSVTGGNGPYAYTWSNGAVTKDLQGLGAGTYSVTLSDANSCTATASFTINQPAALVSSITKVDVNCAGASNGSLDLTVSGGSAPYSYLWNTFQSAQDLINIPGGWYYVVITDANGCSKRDSIRILEPAALIATATPTNVLCNGAATGAVTLAIQGGSPVFQYTWSNGATSQNLTNVIAGTYTVTVRDANLCSATATATITQPSALLVSGSAFNALCAGTNNGSINLSVGGAVLPYSYSWSNGATSKDLQGLGAGTYTVTVSDGNSCTATASFTISQPTAITSSIVGTNVTCYGANNGAADLTVSGGTAPYSYLWSNFGGSQDLANIPGGKYFVVVTDANGCTRKDSVIISEPAQLALTQTVTNISCFNAGDGAISVTVTGGTTPYIYTWSNGANTPTISGLSQATYTLTVRDQNLCTITTSAMVVNPPSINLIAIAKDPLCNAANGSSNGGSIDIVASGGTPGYSYAWSNGATSQNISGLVGGQYILTVTDSRGCTATSTSTIVEPDAIVYNVFTRNVSCKNSKDGFLDITAYGGTLPYSFLWSQGNLTEDIGSLSGGNYSVTITDKNGCTVNGFFIVKEPDTLKVSLTKTDATCQGANTGSVKATVVGGTSPYDFLWNNFSKDSLQNNIPGGIYSVVITDSNNCKTNASIVVNGQPSPMSTTKSISSPTCSDGDNGFASINVTGGAQPYNYSWSTTPTQSGNMATSLAGGTYVVTITDAVGCTKIDTLIVNTPVALTIASSGNANATCANTADGIVNLVATGGKPPYLYSLNGRTQSSAQFTNVAPGNYSISVKDANGCEAASTVTIVSPAIFEVTITANKEVILATQSVDLNAITTSDTTIVSYVWTPVSANFNYSNCSDTTNCPNPSASPTQTTTIQVTATNARGCIATDTIRIEVSNTLSQFIPTAFTPNADGLNDFFEFDILGATNLSVNVYNRWGEKVFSNPRQINGVSQSSANGGWDGTFRGQKVQFDTYTYQIEVTYFNGKKDRVAGTVTVMQ